MTFGLLPWLEQATESGAAADLPAGTLLAFAVMMLGLSAVQFPVQAWLGRNALGKHSIPRPSFQWVDLAVVIVAFVVAQTAIVGWLQWRHPDVASEDLFESMSAVEALGMTALGFALPSVYLLGVAFRRPGGPEALGVRRLTPGYRIVYSGITYVAGLPLFMALGAFATLIFSLGGEEAPKQEVAVMIQDALPVTPIPILFFAVALVPLFEEILFRGFLLELVASRWGAVTGVLASSAAFAILHGEAAALPIFGLAIILGLVKVRTRSLGAAWFVHALHNGGTTFLLWAGSLLPSP